MNESNIYILLKVIFRNGSVKSLTRLKIDLDANGFKVNQAIAEGLVQSSENSIILTERGLQLLTELKEKYKNTKKDEWIEKDEKNRLVKNRREKDFIFVPRLNELTF